jgi:hypothetical protein
MESRRQRTALAACDFFDGRAGLTFLQVPSFANAKGAAATKRDGTRPGVVRDRWRSRRSITRGSKLTLARRPDSKPTAPNRRRASETKRVTNRRTVNQAHSPEA